MNEQRFSWESLLVGVLFLISAFISFTNPGASLGSVVIVFGVTSILKGLVELFLAYRLYKIKESFLPAGLLGLLNLGIGIYLLLNINVGIEILPFVFATWFIADSLLGVFRAGVYRMISPGYYWLVVILNVLGVILGIMLLFDPITSALSLSFMIGFYFLLFGILYIISAFQKR